MDRRLLGTAAETTALEHLLARGLQLVCRNFHCRGGELDLVMLERQTLVIVEVRSRTQQGYGSAADSIGARKRRRLIRAAHYLLLKNPQLRRLPARFDVVTLDKVAGGEGARIEWIRAAFEVGG